MQKEIMKTETIQTKDFPDLRYWQKIPLQVEGRSEVIIFPLNMDE